MKIFESDLAEAIFEVIANTDFRVEAEEFLRSIRVDDSDYNFELDKTNAKITISNSETSFEIIVHRTHVSKPNN